MGRRGIFMFARAWRASSSMMSVFVVLDYQSVDLQGIRR